MQHCACACPDRCPMNHLAHALLAWPDDELVLGSLMGDFVRGAIDPALPAGVRDGIALHRAVDVYTDAHPFVVEARAWFDPPFRRYAGILLDIWLDHLLARDFARWSALPLDTFSGLVGGLLEREHARLPRGMQRFAQYMRANGLLAAYADPDVIARVLAGVGSRLKRANPLADGLIELVRLEPKLDDLFEAFYPQLTAHARQFLERSQARSSRDAPWRIAPI